MPAIAIAPIAPQAAPLSTSPTREPTLIPGAPAAWPASVSMRSDYACPGDCPQWLSRRCDLLRHEQEVMRSQRSRAGVRFYAGREARHAWHESPDASQLADAAVVANGHARVTLRVYRHRLWRAPRKWMPGLRREQVAPRYQTEAEIATTRRPDARDQSIPRLATDRDRRLVRPRACLPDALNGAGRPVEHVTTNAPVQGASPAGHGQSACGERDRHCREHVSTRTHRTRLSAY